MAKRRELAIAPKQSLAKIETALPVAKNAVSPAVSPHVDRAVLRQLSDAVAMPAGISNEEYFERMTLALRQYQGLDARDAAEEMLAMQLVGAHAGAVELMKRALAAGQPGEAAKLNIPLATKLMNVSAKLAETRERLRSKGRQPVVKNMRVEPGGQAMVVGQLAMPARATPSISEVLPAAHFEADARGSVLNASGDEDRRHAAPHVIDGPSKREVRTYTSLEPRLVDTDQTSDEGDIGLEHEYPRVDDELPGDVEGPSSLPDRGGSLSAERPAPAKIDTRTDADFPKRNNKSKKRQGGEGKRPRKAISIAPRNIRSSGGSRNSRSKSHSK